MGSIIQKYNLQHHPFISWLLFKKRILIMRLTFQSASQINLEKGGYYLRRGAMFQVGQPFKTPIPGSTKKKTRYIKNLYFNFGSNSLTHEFTDKPIKGLSERFMPKKKKKRTLKLRDEFKDA